MRPLDVLVIGGGQAGLAAAYHLNQRGCSYAVLEDGHRVGGSWRDRYASLTLFTPRAFSALPGLALDGDPEGYATRDEFADYLERYVRHFGLNVTLRSNVQKLQLDAGGGFTATTADGRVFRGASVIVATGGFVTPLLPAVAKEFEAGVAQLTTASYRQPADVPPGTVLVVGDGASGRDIAMDLAPTHRTLLARGKSRRLLPQRILGRSVWWWLDRLGLLRVGPDSLIGKFMRRADPFPNRDRDLRSLTAAGILIKPRLTAAAGSEAGFADGTRAMVKAVVWAIGYRDDFEWIDIDGALSANGGPIHREGVSPVRGLFFVGRPWQRNRASALIMGVGNDARIVVDASLASTLS